MADDFAEVKAPRLYAFLNVAYYLWLAVMVVAILLDIGNGLDNFLHAPIGIKDNPPPPGPLVDLAQELILPLIIGYFALRVLRWMAKEMGAAFTACTIGLVSFLAVFVSAMLARSHWHYEFIPGSVYLFEQASKLFGYFLVLFWVGADAWFSVGGIMRLIKDKEFRTFRWIAATTGFTVSTILFVAAFIVHFVSKGNAAFSLGFYGVVVVIAGACFAPKEKKDEKTAVLAATDGKQV